MSDTELDRMIERDAERQWEEENPNPPANPIESLSSDVRIQAHAWADTARFMLELALEDIDKACDAVNGTPQGDKLAGMHDQLSDFIYDLREVTREIWGRYKND